MRPQKASNIDVLSGLTRVLRAKGYEGASMADLATATGLKKASLYHRFPGGKQEMAEAVFAHLEQRVRDEVFAALTDGSHPPRLRLQTGLARISEFYEEGNAICLFRAMSMHAGQELFAEQLASGMGEWVAAFDAVGLALHLPAGAAKEYAIQALTDIQGSLILAKNLHDNTIFNRALERIEARYLGA